MRPVVRGAVTFFYGSGVINRSRGKRETADWLVSRLRKRKRIALFHEQGMSKYRIKIKSHNLLIFSLRSRFGAHK